MPSITKWTVERHGHDGDSPVTRCPSSGALPVTPSTSTTDTITPM